MKRSSVRFVFQAHKFRQSFPSLETFFNYQMMTGNQKNGIGMK